MGQWTSRPPPHRLASGRDWHQPAWASICDEPISLASMTAETSAATTERPIRRMPQSAAAAIAALIATSAAYYFGAQLGFQLRFPESPHSVLWPPNAILLAALMLMPWRLWPWCVLYVLPAHVAISLPAGVPWIALFGFYFTNIAQAVLGAALFKIITVPSRNRKRSRSRHQLHRQRRLHIADHPLVRRRGGRGLDWMVDQHLLASLVIAFPVERGFRRHHRAAGHRRRRPLSKMAKSASRALPRSGRARGLRRFAGVLRIPRRSILHHRPSPAVLCVPSPAALGSDAIRRDRRQLDPVGSCHSHHDQHRAMAGRKRRPNRNPHAAGHLSADRDPRALSGIDLQRTPAYRPAAQHGSRAPGHGDQDRVHRRLGMASADRSPLRPPASEVSHRLRGSGSSGYAVSLDEPLSSGRRRKGHGDGAGLPPRRDQIHRGRASHDPPRRQHALASHARREDPRRQRRHRQAARNLRRCHRAQAHRGRASYTCATNSPT